MRDYYKPRLLPLVLADEELKPLRPLASLNRVQPLVKVKKIEGKAIGLTQVTVEAMSVRSDVQKDASGSNVESGVYDVRLFRDGQMVGQWPELGRT